MSTHRLSLSLLLAASALFCGSAFAIEPTPAQLKTLADQLDSQTEVCKRRVQEAELRLSLAEAKVVYSNKEPSKIKLPKNKEQREIAEREREERKDRQEMAEQQKKQKIEAANRQLVWARRHLLRCESCEMPVGRPLFEPENDESLSRPIKVGDVSYFDDSHRTNILQILNENEMIVSVNLPRTGAHAVFLLRAPTTGLADDYPISLVNGSYFVTGTYKYEATGGGGKTVMVLEELDAKAVREFLKQRITKAEAAKNAAQPK